MAPAVSKPSLETLVRELQAEVARLREVVSNRARLHRKEVLARYGFGKSTLYRRLQRGLFPRPVKFGGPIWALSDLEQAERDGLLPGPVAGR